LGWAIASSTTQPHTAHHSSKTPEHPAPHQPTGPMRFPVIHSAGVGLCWQGLDTYLLLRW
jgi:hypothetical protein